MQRAPFILCLTLCSSRALAHGGPPFTDGVLWAPQGLRTLTTTHGFLFEDEGWSWVCEEVLGEAARSGVAQTSAAWVVSTTHGIVSSQDGCHWDWNDDLSGKYVSGVQTDPHDADVLWVATLDGLWRSDDHGAHFIWQMIPTQTASVRSFSIASDGTFYVLGFEGAAPTVWVGRDEDWSSSVLPIGGGILEMVGTDGQNRGYGRSPRGLEGDTLWRFDVDAAATPLVSWDANISAFAWSEEALVVSFRRVGFLHSTDDGATWSTPTGTGAECLVERGGSWFACPPEGEDVALSASAGMPGLADTVAGASQITFRDIAGPRCPEDTPTAQVCDPLWPTVAMELGVEDSGGAASDTDTDLPGEDDPKKTRGGCSHAPALRAWLWFSAFGIRRT